MVRSRGADLAGDRAASENPMQATRNPLNPLPIVQWRACYHPNPQPERVCWAFPGRTAHMMLMNCHTMAARLINKEDQVALELVSWPSDRATL